MFVIACPSKLITFSTTASDAGALIRSCCRDAN